MHATHRLAVVMILAAAAAAQEGPADVPELQRLRVFEGSWQGEGTAINAPGAAPMKWASQTVTRWALGGQWLMSDTSIVIGTLKPQYLREYVGYDRMTHRYVNVVITSAGTGDLSQVHFIGDDLIVQMNAAWRASEPFLWRASQRIGKDAIEQTVSVLGVDGPALEIGHVRMVRAAAAKPDELLAAAGSAAPRPVMVNLARMVGDYDVVGAMGEGGKQAVKGHDAIRTLFEGAAVQVLSKSPASDGMPAHEAHGYYVWDEALKQLVVLSVDSFGMAVRMPAGFVGDDQIAAVMSGLQDGMPFTSRVVLQLDAAGKPKHMVSTSCTGGGAPVQDFTADYTPAAKATK